MSKIIHAELSYKIVGVLYKVFKDLGAGLQEKYYQKAIKRCLQKEKIPFLEQVRVEIELEGEVLGRYLIDFVIEHKIVLEIKSKPHFNRADIQQVLGYLKKGNLELGLLARFGSDGVKVKRILKGYN